MADEFYDVNQWRDTPNGRRATKIGFAKEKKDQAGFYCTLDCLPLPQLYEGKLTCQISIDKQKPRTGSFGGGGTRTVPQRQQPRRDEMDEEIPF